MILENHLSYRSVPRDDLISDHCRHCMISVWKCKYTRHSICIHFPNLFITTVFVLDIMAYQLEAVICHDRSHSTEASLLIEYTTEALDKGSMVGLIVLHLYGEFDVRGNPILLK